MKHRQSFLHCDNSPTVSWVTKMATRHATSEAAHRLLRGLAMQQRHLQCPPLCIVHLSGKHNPLADIPSRAIPSLPSESHFLPYFDALFPLQNKSWQRVSPNAEMLSNVTLTLRGQRLQLRRWTPRLASQAGVGGHSTQPNVELIHGSATSPPQFNRRSSWVLPPGFELDATATVGRMVTKLLKKPSVTWHKPGCWLDTVTPGARTKMGTSSTSPSPISSKRTKTPTQPQNPN